MKNKKVLVLVAMMLAVTVVGCGSKGSESKQDSATTFAQSNTATDEVIQDKTEAEAEQDEVSEASTLLQVLEKENLFANAEEKELPDSFIAEDFNDLNKIYEWLDEKYPDATFIVYPERGERLTFDTATETLSLDTILKNDSGMYLEDASGEDIYPDISVTYYKADAGQVAFKDVFNEGCVLLSPRESESTIYKSIEDVSVGSGPNNIKTYLEEVSNLWGKPTKILVENSTIVGTETNQYYVVWEYGDKAIVSRIQEMIFDDSVEYVVHPETYRSLDSANVLLSWFDLKEVAAW